MGGEEPYHGYEAAAHVARYALLRPICAGRRILDIACGEGYGSALLARWGAREVVGADISTEAIEAAQLHFSHPEVRFLQGDAEQAATLLRDEPPFDLVVSFETVEHVADPTALLTGLRRLCAPGGTIVLSCPNDPAALPPDAVNPYHLRTYTFEQFREFAEAILGPASSWLIETPAIGMLHYRLGDAAAEVAAASPADIVKVQHADGCLRIPAQRGVAPSAQDCLAYVGIWGTALQPSCAVSPLSHSGYMFPWRQIERLERDAAQQNGDRQDDRRQLLHYAETISALRQSQQADRERAMQLAETIAQQTAAIAALEARIDGLGQLATTAEQRRSDTEHRFAAQQTELNLARQWREGVERSPFYRLMQAYTGLYRQPVIGPVLSGARRGAVWMLNRGRGG